MITKKPIIIPKLDTQIEEKDADKEKDLPQVQ